MMILAFMSKRDNPAIGSRRCWGKGRMNASYFWHAIATGRERLVRVQFHDRTRGRGPAPAHKVLPASCRHNETIRDRRICRQDAGSTLAGPHSVLRNALLNRRERPVTSVP